MRSAMEHVSVNGVELEFACVGSGEPVVFIHGGGIADTGLPLAAEPALNEHYRMIRYRRRGYAGSTRIQGPVSIAEHAQDCRALLGALDVRQAHIISHSYSAVVAVRLAVDAPEVVSSLALFDPSPLVVMTSEEFDDAIRPSIRPIMDNYLAGDPVAAVDGIFSEVFGLDWRAEVSRTVPGGPEQADQDAATLFESDLRAGQQWHFGAEEAAKITQPVLFLTGTDSLPIFVEVRDRLHAYLPQTEDDVMPEANHLLHLRHPADAAARLAGFLKRHPIA
ncbi:MAG TPA: alpha/beta hydrolase [Pseudonocardiaceae bacterium]|jgi:pimeloyl-ACP methyl ester carboxylesterase|nr:alpha/beta hydrolase [Pseudonocardiaceae bacterium]